MNKKQAINEDRVKEITESFTDPKKYKAMIVAHYFPLERFINPFETREEYIERRFKEICETFSPQKKE